MTTISDFLWANVGGGVVNTFASRWVKFVSNRTSIAYVSDSATNSGGLYTMSNLPTDSYSIYYGLTSNPAGTWVDTGNHNYLVGSVDGSGVSTFGSGDQINYGGESTTGSRVDIRIGTSGTPDTSGNPVMKASRTFNGITGAPFVGQPVSQVSTAAFGASNIATSAIQVFGVTGYATTISTAASGANGKGDAGGVAGVAFANDPTTHLASGGFFVAQMNTAAITAEGATGIQLAVQNRTGLGDHTVNATGFSKTVGLYITAGNSFDLNGAAIEICNTGIGGHGVNAGRFDVGLHVPAQLANSLTGAIATAVVQDDGQSTYSYLVKGTRVGAAIAVASGSGSLVLGETALQVSTALLEVMTSTQADPLVEVRTNSAVAISNRVVRGPAGSIKFGYVGTNGQFLTGTLAGETTLVPTTPFHIGGTTRVLTINASNQIGFFTKTPVGQYSTTGTSTGFTAGAGTTATHLSTFTGNNGSTAYTIGDVVNALKLYGLMAV